MSMSDLAIFQFARQDDAVGTWHSISQRNRLRPDMGFGIGCNKKVELLEGFCCLSGK